MCGICGKYSPKGVSRGEIETMMDTLIHRGPDDQGIYLNGEIGLGSRRLSIIDLQGGKMPISNEDQSIWIVYNGEIYNYQALRKTLQAKGHVFKTHSDTEVIVHLYEEYGEGCVEKLRGMFAFAIWDRREKKLVLARDRIGQKPLFYARQGNDFWFASELKAILAVSKQARGIDFEALHHYLSLRFIPSPHTMLRNINKLPPGHVLVFRGGELSLTRYWHLSFQEKLNLPEGEFIEGLHDKLKETIAAHLVSDVPVGAFLSGGMDSSMIVAIMGGDLGRSFDTFSVGVEEQDYNELPYARAVAERYRTRHIERCVKSGLIGMLPKIIWHLDEPSDPIAACQFHAAELAAQHVKVVLGGDGGDELFAGFDRYLGIGYVNYYTLIPAFLRRKIFGPLFNWAPDNFAYKNTTQKLRWIHQLSLLPDNGERYAEATCFFRFNHREKQFLLSDDLWRRVEHLNSAGVIVEQFDNAPADDTIDKMLYADLMTRLPEHSLMLSDRMTMAHSLELRSPFLDHELIELLAAFPGNLKIRNRELKYVLRKLAANYLPEEIAKREKQGFMFPIAYWFRNELYPFLNQFLLNSQLVKEGVLRPDRVKALIEAHRHNRADHHIRLWMLLNLEIWYQLYIAPNSRESIEAKIRACI
ncbi:MAG: asparagine synthase (glutamine-hydrolyzing) [Calditrichaceae bacterium]|nr:asparagine synthase (glutamine-hydrolyzing) [Calditrichia bacterium]NUQ40604.1 asparagine synthase (glutamine-hydrolyzing) [Calditrichaceae bacterium]